MEFRYLIFSFIAGASLRNGHNAADAFQPKLFDSSRFASAILPSRFHETSKKIHPLSLFSDRLRKNSSCPASTIPIQLDNEVSKMEKRQILASGFQENPKKILPPLFSDILRTRWALEGLCKNFSAQ